MSTFRSYAFTAADDVFTTPVGGSSFMPVGEHEVTISSATAEEGQYGLQFIIEFKNAAGQTIKDYINLVAQNKEGETGVKPHYKYLRLGQAIISEPATLHALLKQVIPSNPANIDCVKHSKVLINVAAPTKGHTIVDITGGKAILNLEFNTYVGDDDGNTLVYASFDAAKTAAKAMDLKMAYNKVDKIMSAGDEAQAYNLTLVKAFLTATNAGASKLRQATPGRPSARTV